MSNPTSNEPPARRSGTSARCRVRRIAARARRDERGAGHLAAFIVLFSMLVVAGVGILVDSARIAIDDAAAQAAASTAATAFVSGAGADLVAVSIDGDVVTAVVSADFDSWFPLISDRTVTQSASARAANISD